MIYGISAIYFFRQVITDRIWTTYFRPTWCMRYLFENKYLGMRVCSGWRQFLLFVTLVFFLTHFLSGNHLFSCVFSSYIMLYNNLMTMNRSALSSQFWSCIRTQMLKVCPKRKPKNLIISFLDPLLVKVCQIVCNAKVFTQPSNSHFCH